jgi:hypothetical protein
MLRRVPYYFLLLGLGLRLFHFLRCPSVWHDEAALIINVIGKDYRELLGTLFHHEAGPPLFLWIEHFMAQNFGDGVWSLRFPVFLASCASLILFWDLCQRTLEEWSQIWAVMLFAVSDRLLWHSCEAKPYTFDVLVAVSLALGFQRTRAWSITRQCLLWMPILPICIWLSYPACFLSGGIILGLLVQMYESSKRVESVIPENNDLRELTLSDRLRNIKIPSWPFIALLILLVGLSFLALAIGPAKAQRDGAMESCWSNHFPDWSRPWMVPIWSFFSTTDILRYNLIPLGQFLTLIAIFGAIQTWREGNRAWLAVLLGPALLTFIASCLHKYPYGGSRVEAFLCPAIVWLIAKGSPPSFDRLKRKLPIGQLALGGLLLLPLGQMAFRAVVAWPRADCVGAADYVLEHMHPDEGLIINHWEYEYYFRHAAIKPIYAEEGFARPAPVVWLIFTADDAKTREKDLGPWLTVGTELERREFVRTTVVKIEFNRETIHRSER